MKRLLIYIVMSVFLFSCGAKDKRTQLRELESQRAELDQQIEQLKAELGDTNGNLQNEKVVSVKIASVQPTEFKHFIKVQGTVESDNNIMVPPQAGGVVKTIHVSEGDNVTKGQLLAELDGAVYESTLAELNTQLELAQTVFERQERLWNKKIGSEIQYLKAKTDKESLEQKIATVTEQYKLTKIKAPIAGTVDEVLIKEGEAAAAGFGAIRIVKLSDLKITASVSENYITQVKKGDIVNVQVPVLDRQFDQPIDAVSQVIEPRNRTFMIEIKIPAGEPDIKPNMLVVLEINDYTNPNALTVPVNIVQSTGDDHFLFTTTPLEGNNDTFVARKQFVKVGKHFADKVEILDGLVAGTQVVTFGYQNLADGQNVKVSR